MEWLGPGSLGAEEGKGELREKRKVDADKSCSQVFLVLGFHVHLDENTDIQLIFSSTSSIC